jgi:uncharacterized membrane protein required for colicin V production
MNALRILLGYINWVDIFIVICLIRTLYMGFTRGFTAEITRFLSLIAVIVLTYHYYGRLGLFLSGATLLGKEAAANASFLILAVGWSLLFKIVCVLLRMVIKISGPNLFEKAAGVAIGILRGLLLASFVLAVLTYTNVTYFRRSTYERSFIGARVAELTPKTFGYFNIRK